MFSSCSCLARASLMAKDTAVEIRPTIDFLPAIFSPDLTFPPNYADALFCS